VLAVMRTGRWDPSWDGTHQEALASRLPILASTGVTLDDFRVLAKHSMVFGHVLHERWMATCDLVAVMDQAKKSLQGREERLAMWAEFRQ